jgi:hypothetical protein
MGYMSPETFAAWLAAERAEVWAEAIHHVEPMLYPSMKRAAMRDNPYRKH